MTDTQLRVQKALSKKSWRSALEIAERAKCYKGTVYSAIGRLREQGAVIASKKEPREVSGPSPALYLLVQEAKA
jgi:predicted transcriptional regulator